jgi:uracil-DNA glycosylase
VSSPLAKLLAFLAAGPADPEHVFNPWRDHDERDGSPRKGAPRARLENFAAYVDARRVHARVMLLGEAPSHRGCRFTGIPFCSEVEFVHKPLLLGAQGLRPTSAGSPAQPMSERSAAVIWDELDRAGCAREVVLWNAFPWHPHAAGNVTSNRKPRLAEVAQGHGPFEALLACFTHDIAVFAVGKVAEDALRRWGRPCAGYIRHPSHGGESRFRAEFRSQVLSRLER